MRRAPSSGLALDGRSLGEGAVAATSTARRARRARASVRPRTPVALTRLSFLVLLAATAVAPEVRGSYFTYPAVANAWTLFAFGALFVVGLLASGAASRQTLPALLALLVPLVMLAFYSHPRPWVVLFVYPPLAYLAWRMLAIARGCEPKQGARRASVPCDARGARASLPRSWLVLAIVVLGGVHLSWALDTRSGSDVGYAGVRGALAILDGQRVYAAEPKADAEPASDPHYDSYGPLNYEAYVPLAIFTGARLAPASGVRAHVAALPFANPATAGAAARLTTLLFDLLTALLLFLLARSIGRPTAGVALAFGWLAYPFTLYGQAFAFNDSIMAAALLVVLLSAQAPFRRGTAAALAAWTKLTPLALVPALMGHRADRRSVWVTFGAGFLLASLVVFAPLLAHLTPATFASRTVGFQINRGAEDSLWALVSGGYFGQGWITVAVDVAHALLVALAGAFAVALLWIRRREDVVGLAASTALVMITIVVVSSVYATNYVLWFAPLALAALVLGRSELGADASA